MTHSSPDTIAVPQTGDTPDRRVYVDDLLVLSLRLPLLALSDELDRTKRAMALVQVALGVVAALFIVDAFASSPDIAYLASRSADQASSLLRQVIPAAERVSTFVDEIIPHWPPSHTVPETRRKAHISETRASRLAATKNLPTMVSPPAVAALSEPKPTPPAPAAASVEPKPTPPAPAAAPVEPKPTPPAAAATPVEPKPTPPAAAATPVEPKPTPPAAAATPVEPKPPGTVATLAVPKAADTSQVAPEQDFAEAFKAASRMLERRLTPEERATPMDSDFLDAVLRIEGIYDPTRVGPFGTALRMAVRPGTMSMRNVFGDAWTRAIPDPNVHYRVQYYAETWLRPKATKCDDFWRFRPDNFLVRLDKLAPDDCKMISAALSRDDESLRDEYVVPAAVTVPTFAAPYPGGRMSGAEMRAALQARIQAAEERLWFKRPSPPPQQTSAPTPRS